MHASWTARVGAKQKSRLRLGLAALAMLCSPMLATAGPLKSSGFDHAPVKVNYFPDSPIVMYHDQHDVYLSQDEGGVWDRVRDIPEGKAYQLVLHAFEPKTAFVLTAGTTHYKTVDQGKTWTEFTTTLMPITERHVLAFHAKRPQWILIAGVATDGQGNSHDETYYTRDGFQTAPTKLLAYTHKCEWALSSEVFDEAPESLIHCLEFKDHNGETSLGDIQMVKSEDYFATKSVVDMGFTGQGAVINFVTKENFILAAERHLVTNDMSLYVSLDGRKWAKSLFPSGTRIGQESYTILESPAYSLLVDVQADRSDYFGSLMYSNSEGTQFVQSVAYTNRDENDLVDFEKIQNVDGVYMVNVVDNHDSNPVGDRKNLRSQITFDAGATWQYIMPPSVGVEGKAHPCDPNKDGSCSLHLHSVTTARVTAPIFSSKAAPGVIMGVGNVGSRLLPWVDCDTWLSEDGGLTWKAVLKYAHKYEFGDMGGIIVAIRDDDRPTSALKYSSDRGKTWVEVDMEENVTPGVLLSDPESTSQKFMLYVRSENANSRHDFYCYQLDLTNLFDGKKCVRRDDDLANSDFEKWYARNVGNNPDCLMGAKSWYWRRKEDAKCLVDEDFKDPAKTDEYCPCTDEDFECDYNFKWDGSNCVADGPEAIPGDACKKTGDTYLASSGYRYIPGNACDKEKGLKKADRKSKTCTAISVPTDIKRTVFPINNPIAGGFQYFMDSSVVMFITEGAGEIWRSEDDGSTWKPVSPDGDGQRFLGLFLHDVDKKRAYLFTETDVWVTTDRGVSFRAHKLPALPNQIERPLVDFHPDSDKHDWMLFLGQKETECFTRLYRTEDAGKNWYEVDSFIEKAVYADHSTLAMPVHGIFALSWKNKAHPSGRCQIDLEMEPGTNSLEFVFMRDDGEGRKVHFEHAVQFFVVEKFLAVATESNGDYLLQVSVDGKNFNQAVFPSNIHLDKNAFTVLQSTTGSLMVDVARSTVEGREYGLLFKSTNDGKSYSLQLENSNRDKYQKVDWEKIGGIEGIILANKVSNIDTLAKDGGKRLQSLISFDDGSTWNPLPAPSGTECEGCHLHLHSVTDQLEGSGLVFTSPSSVGLVIGVGNVGPYLTTRDKSQTYLSRDAGKTWRMIDPVDNFYEFADEGGVLVMGPTSPTRTVKFSYDFGTSWHTTQIHEEEVMISAITIETTARTSKVLIVGMVIGNGDDGLSGIISTLDFSERPECKFDKGNPEKNDFEKWSPFEGESNACILGRDIKYWRRKPDRLCRVNDKDGEPETEQAQCQCTERDYECAVGYFRDPELHKCVRYGYDPERPKDCKGTYMATPGYKKLDRTACTGKELYQNKEERQCGAINGIQSKVTAFESKWIENSFFYFENSDVCMMRTEESVWISRNEGKEWSKVVQAEDSYVISLQRHPFDKTTAIITTSERTHFITRDRGLNWDPIEAPTAPNSLGLRFWSFHPLAPDWLLYMGDRNCDGNSDGCYSESFMSLDGGSNWKSVATWARSCAWARGKSFEIVDYEGIYCELYVDKNGSQQKANKVEFVYSSDFMDSRMVLFESIRGYAIYSDYLVVAELYQEKNELKIWVSTNGVDFGAAKYPSNVDVFNPAFTILDSTTKSVFLSVLTNDRKDSMYGDIYSSDSNGTSFSSTIQHISANNARKMDFEKMQGVNGVALVNQVLNPQDARQGRAKKLQSMLTMDNGKTWNPLQPPDLDSEGKNYEDCDGTTCSLNVHNYADRNHVEDMFSSATAPGMMLAVGVVGKELSKKNGDTFLTRDAGHSWKEVHKGAFMYDFGDQGGILLMVDDEDPTNDVLYSLDQGETFQKHEFSKDKVVVKDIITKTNGIGMSFMLFAEGGRGRDSYQVISVDFEGLNLRPCVLNLQDEDHDDFERWNLAKLRGKECMFGRKIEYFRRLPSSQCSLNEQLPNPRTIETACQCTVEDFECDYNYERDPNDATKCVLIKGASPAADYDAKEITKICSTLEDSQEYFYQPRGYRKMGISGCVGDHELFGDKVYCPNHGSGGGIGFFGGVGILFAAGAGAFSVLWCMGQYRAKYARGGRRSRIRLGDDSYDDSGPSLLPRSSSLPSYIPRSVRLPTAWSGSLRNLRVPNSVYDVWDKVATAALSIPVLPTRVTNYFNRVRYSNLSTEPGEVIMDDYFDNYLDDDDEGADAAQVGSTRSSTGSNRGSGGFLFNNSRRSGTAGNHHLVGGEDESEDEELDGLADAQERFRDDSDDEHVGGADHPLGNGRTSDEIV